MEWLFGNTMGMTQKSLDYLWTKQTVSLDNIANVDTPGFKARYATFEDSLKQNMAAAGRYSKNQREAMEAGIGHSRVTIHDTQDAARLDGNNVQIEAENTELVRSYLQYQYQVQSVNSDINRLRIAIKG